VPEGALSATGILLVGGASSRFGSPKALAELRGEALAERAWRTLHEVCDEVLAVGKAGAGLELPFPVLDDGTEEHAPVFGLVAGLRAASHDVCLALPVDCPMVTPEALRALVEAEAVPQTGPLPGTYTRALLPELEDRIARGELSLRGLNANVLELAEGLLLNVNTPRDLYAAGIADWARSREDVRGVVVVGSYARRDAPADRWSDLDVAVFADEPQRLVEDADWVAELGTPVLTFLEPTAIGGRVERRVLYDDGQDVDFIPLAPADLPELPEVPGIAALLGRGHLVLHDELGLSEALAGVEEPPPEGAPDAGALTELASDLWYHALWTARKLRRGEVFTAIGCLDGYLMWRLVPLFEWHARAVDPSIDTWHNGRFLERWADPGALAALEEAYARYDLRDVARGLWATIDLFQGLTEETAARLGLELGIDQADLRRRVAEAVPDPRRAL
jgi:molybdopterin-guanine dinucleotide biosynthesis protein A/predicted nucleotidyltransferase